MSQTQSPFQTTWFLVSVRNLGRKIVSQCMIKLLLKWVPRRCPKTIQPSQSPPSPLPPTKHMKMSNECVDTPDTVGPCKTQPYCEPEERPRSPIPQIHDNSSKPSSRAEMCTSRGRSGWAELESSLGSMATLCSTLDTNCVTRACVTVLCLYVCYEKSRVGNEPSHEPILACEMARKSLVAYISYF